MNELIHIGKVTEFDKLHNRLIYVALAENGFVKVGVTKDYSKREKRLSNTEYGKITRFFETERCINSFEVEKAIHEKLKEYRHFGEWYKAEFDFVVGLVKGMFSDMAVTKRKNLNSENTKAKYKCDTLLDYFHKNEVRMN